MKSFQHLKNKISKGSDDKAADITHRDFHQEKFTPEISSKAASEVEKNLEKRMGFFLSLRDSKTGIRDHIIFKRNSNEMA